MMDRHVNSFRTLSELFQKSLRSLPPGEVSQKSLSICVFYKSLRSSSQNSFRSLSEVSQKSLRTLSTPRGSVFYRTLSELFQKSLRSLSVLSSRGNVSVRKKSYIEDYNKSPEQRLNLSRSWHKGHSRAYNTSFFI
jgi:hypothetical protein